eukprot:TRINITY_DN3802_c0_g1_i1.p2 TRINITY_DN3802_c0_g1~~TRINITY_DN3802_c0_g1_i1.p2  ORF type:complete len:84 (-),score=18.57 TRINITY_DN3802_c0_g1_i1:104-355(-)
MFAMEDVQIPEQKVSEPESKKRKSPQKEIDKKSAPHMLMGYVQKGRHHFTDRHTHLDDLDDDIRKVLNIQGKSNDQDYQNNKS